MSIKLWLTKKVNNGVNVEALLEAREAFTASPEGAKFTWRTKCDWVNGTHRKTSVEGFFGLGEEQKHKSKFSFYADHPEIFAPEDNFAIVRHVVGFYRP